MNVELTTLTDVESPSEAVRIERASLHNVVVSRIRDMIIEGLIAVGARIHEGQLCQQLGISRTPLREALKVLASEGLVELVPSRGAVVRRMTRKDAHDMMNVLAHLEQMAGSLTCQNATDAQIREVRRLHDEMLKFYAARDRLGRTPVILGENPALRGSARPPTISRIAGSRWYPGAFVDAHRRPPQRLRARAASASSSPPSPRRERAPRGR